MLDKKSCGYLIAYNLIKLPSDFFCECDLSEPQLNYWLSMREKTRLESAYWHSLFEGGSDPLAELVSKGIINEWDRKRTVNQVDFYQRFWELTHSIEPHLRKEWGESYPLKNVEQTLSAPALLFVNVLREFIDGKFKESLLPYFNFSTKDLALVCADSQGKVKRPQQKKAAKQAAKRLTQNQSQVIDLLCFCDYISKKDSVVKMRLKAWKSASDEIAAFMEAAAKRTRNTTNTTSIPSYTWEKSRLKSATGRGKGGTYA
jgi:hypothetical protein